MILLTTDHYFPYRRAPSALCRQTTPIAKSRIKRKKPKDPGKGCLLTFPATSKCLLPPPLYILLLLAVISYLNVHLQHPSSSIFLPGAAAAAAHTSVKHDYFDITELQHLAAPSAFTSSVLGPVPSGATTSQCPVVCSCIWKSGKQTATCDRRNLASVPIGLASTTQVIDLSGNSLNVLPPNVFLDRGLINLQRIFLVDCALREISSESFVKLSNLIELDLSNNSLTTVPSKSFAEAAALRRLSLAGNRIREVTSAAFLSLGRLNVLDLSGNALVHLETDAFRGLRSLQTLKLEGNQLATIPAADSFVQFLPIKMASLGLHDNRWRCDCHLKPVREWIAANNIPLPVKPICSAPARLIGQKWDAISSHEFSCPPQIHSTSTHFYKHIGNNVTITCPVTGYPQPVIFWIFESTSHLGAELFESRISLAQEEHSTPTTTLKAINRTRVVGGSTTELPGTSSAESSSDLPATTQHHHGYEQLLPNYRYSVSQEMENNHQLISTLTVHSLKPADTQRITCYARNIGGIVMKNFSLAVSTQEPFSSSRSMDFIVTEMFVIVVSICILLLIVVIFIGFFITKLKKRSPGSHLVHAEGNEGGNSAPGGAVQSQHNHYGGSMMAFGGGNGNDGGFGLKTGAASAGGIISFGEKGGILVDGQTVQYTSTSPHHHSQQPNGLLMVNTIDMIHSAMELQKNACAPNGTQSSQLPPHFTSDPNSTDLSSQSTTATSMTLNSASATAVPSSTNGVSPNGSSDTSAGSLPPYYSTGSSYLVDGTQLLDHSEGTYGTHYRQGGQQQLGMTPDLLATTAQPHYYVTDMNGTLLAPSRVNLCDAYAQGIGQHSIPHPDPAYPLLNTGQLLDPTASGELIYGTRIAPTRPLPGLTSSASCHGNLGNFLYTATTQAPGKLTKVKFADQMGLDQPPDRPHQGAYVYATLRKPPPSLRASGSASSQSSTSTTDSQSLKPLTNYHRNVASYPDGFTSLMESSVDSGEAVGTATAETETRNSSQGPPPVAAKPKHLIRSATVDSLDEAEEDDYYRRLNGGAPQEGEHLHNGRAQ